MVEVASAGDSFEGEAIAPRQVWNQMVASSFAQFRQTSTELLFPWETGVMADIFNVRQDPLPQCPGLVEQPLAPEHGHEADLQDKLVHFLPDSAKCIHAVRSLQDLSCFDAKAQKLELACGQWLNLLAIEWSASGVGPQLVHALQRDHSGAEATTILSACFGVKSPATLLKRASAFKKYACWLDKHAGADGLQQKALPLDEVAVWQYFLWLKQRRI